MTQSDIIFSFITIVYGLMLLELVSRLHFLLRKRNVVKWHFLPILSSWYVFIIVLRNWWYLSLTEKLVDYSLLEFLFTGHTLIVLYLVTTSVLPDKIDDKGIDLKKFYFNNHRYFWGVFSLSLFMILSKNVFEHINSDKFTMFGIIVTLFLLGISIILTINKKYWVHVIGLSLFVINTILELFF